MPSAGFAVRIRRLREAAGLTQGQLAARAGMSRQMVGAIEAARHLPRVDAAAALAGVLGTTVESLLEPDAVSVCGVLGEPATSGPVRLGRVGDRLVCAPAPTSGEAWTPADGVVHGDVVELLPQARPGTVVAGCDPAIGLAARLVTDRAGAALLAVSASTRAALEALQAGRTHAAVVHGPAGALPDAPVAVRRWHLARWRVGLAASPDLPAGWWRDALGGRRPVVQREAGAGSQAAFARAAAEAGGQPPPGPRAGGHLEAAALARAQGGVAVTIEPAARAAGLAFHPLEAHVAQLWVAVEWAGGADIALLGEAVASSAFHRQLAAVGGYDLSGCGSTVAA